MRLQAFPTDAGGLNEQVLPGIDFSLIYSHLLTEQILQTKGWKNAEENV